MPSKTIQSQKDEADINVIVKRFGLTGQLPDNIRTPQYADFEEVIDFKTAQDKVAEARSSFLQLPATMRRKFDNDPQQFLEFCGDPKNIPELVELGLAKLRPNENDSQKGTSPEAPS